MTHVYRKKQAEMAVTEGDIQKYRDRESGETERRRAQNESEAQASSGRGRGATERGKQEIEEEQGLAW